MNFKHGKQWVVTLIYTKVGVFDYKGEIHDISFHWLQARPAIINIFCVGPHNILCYSTWAITYCISGCQQFYIWRKEDWLHNYQLIDAAYWKNNNLTYINIHTYKSRCHDWSIIQTYWSQQNFYEILSQK